MIKRDAPSDEKPVLYLEHMSKDTLDVARSHLNWMNFRGGMQDIDDNPFNFRYIKPITNYRDLLAELDQKKQRVIVTSSASLEQGFAKRYLRDFSLDQNNMLIFTEQYNLMESCTGKKIFLGDRGIRDAGYCRSGISGD